MGSKLWLIAVLLLAVSICACYEALEVKNEDALIEDGAIPDTKNKDVSKEEVDDDDQDEMDDDEDDDEDDGEDDDEDDPDEIEVDDDDLDEKDYEDPSPWLFSRRTPSRPRPTARRSWSWRRPRVPSRPRPPRRGSWSWRRPRRPVPRPRPRPRPPVLPPRPPVPRPRPPVRPPLPPNPPVPTRRPVRPGFWFSRRPRPPVPRPRPSVLPPRPPAPRPRPPVPPPPPAPPQGDCSLMTFRGSHFRTPAGFKITRVESGFYDDINRINGYARSCSVTVYVVSSFRTKVIKAIHSNHLVGHAIDMNLQDKRGYCNSGCLKKPPRSFKGVSCFISRIRSDRVLRWGGDFTKVDPVHIDDNLYHRDTAEWNRLRQCFVASG